MGVALVFLIPRDQRLVVPISATLYTIAQLSRFPLSIPFHKLGLTIYLDRIHNTYKSLNQVLSVSVIRDVNFIYGFFV